MELDLNDQLIDSTLISSIADNPACVGGEVGFPQAFGKQRRANACQSPKKGSENEGQGSGKKPSRNPLSLQQWLDDLAQTDQFFPDSEELCPAKIFLFSTIPVCVNDLVSRITRQVPFMHSNIWNVLPGAYVGL